ncbi:hypothetical protein RIF23_16245 [Lipingzhangella sp. LS1_29]|uniref:DUF11 domain-containing protein n=1 Tax=Lipingzhangella rawalii TaxID=2055835 RepID=A0ABU2HAG9_9ACTN|nr:hypothetical protein [Lipingzhangella rawalii]MDS1271845.1 hypothetical protein [Lipingzhangella rawalii]
MRNGEPKPWTALGTTLLAVLVTTAMALPAWSASGIGPAAAQGAPSLQLTKTVAPDPLVIGEQAQYTITVTNTGDTDAEDVTVVDQLDHGIIAGDLPDPCTADGQDITCGGSGFTVSAGETVEFVLPVTVDSALADGTNIVNEAEVSTSTPDAGTDSTRLITIAQTMTDVEITKSGPATVEPGGTITYTVEVTNHGPSEAVDVTVQDPTNGNLTAISELPEQCPDSGLTISCALGILEPGETVTLTFVLTAADLAEGATIDNCATVYTGSRESNVANNVSCVSTDVGTDVDASEADVEISKSGPATVEPDGTITYTLTASNVGSAAADDVHLLDPIDLGQATLTEFPEQCEIRENTLICEIGHLDPGESVDLEFTVHVAADAQHGSIVHNCVLAYSPSRAVSADANRDCVDTEVEDPSPDPSPSPTDEPDPSPSPTDEPKPTPTEDPDPGPEPTEHPYPTPPTSVGPEPSSAPSTDADPTPAAVPSSGTSTGPEPVTAPTGSDRGSVSSLLGRDDDGRSLPTTGAAIGLMAALGAVLIVGGLMLWRAGRRAEAGTSAQ